MINQNVQSTFWLNKAKWIEDTFISDSKEYDSVPLRKVSRLRNFGSGNNYIGKMW